MSKKLKFGIIVFPGSNCDADCLWAIRDVMNQDAEFVWHESRNIKKFDCIILPGGFSYGDYLRSGAIARFAKVMESIYDFANKKNKFIIGICNGFQILLEAGLLPGAMLHNKNLKFICEYVNIVVENNSTPFTNRCVRGQILKIPVAHGEGNYYCDERTLNTLIASDKIVFRYCDDEGRITDEANINGSIYNIAGIMNAKGNILGMMPHPERAMIKQLTSEDGRLIWQSIIEYIKKS